MARAALLALIALAGALAGCLQPASSECEGGGICPPGLRCARAGDQQICVQPTCGNGVKDPGEACDDGNNVSGDGCPANCGPACGDGIRDPDEACDDGNTVGGDGCSADCKSTEVCGNGILDPGEACDDGSLRDHDGCSSRCAIEQPAWSTVGANPTALRAVAAYDAARGVTVLVQNDLNAPSVHTWEWDGVAWRERSSATVPPALGEPTLIYDVANRRVVELGFDKNGWTAWAWDGIQWTAHPPAASPPELIGYAMAYDVIRKKVVLFGGGLSTSVGTILWQSDTWEWDGNTWEKVTTHTVPPERGDHVMAYDSRRGVVVVYGGENDQGVSSDVWEYDGNDWTRHPSAPFPAPNPFAGAMVFDAARGAVAMIGGLNGSPDLWEWDGAQWTRYSSPTEPLSRFAPAVAYDLARRTLVLFGGVVNLEQFAFASVNDTWEWNGTIWVERAVRTLARQGGGMTYDPVLHRILMFSGNELNEPAADTGAGMLNDTWSWDGASWVPVSPPDAFPVEPNTTPPVFPVARRAFATAIAGQESIVWGGLDATGVRGDGWIFLNGGWSQLAQGFGIQPSARWHNAMAYDAFRNKLILFGGLAAAGQPLADTWAWDSQSFQNPWALLAPAHVPPPRHGHAMAWDTIRQRIVMFGGDGGDALLADTWTWDGTDWTAQSSAAPPARRDHAVAFDAARGRLVLFGGDGGDALLADTWEWDGTAWLPRTPATVPPARSAHMMAYDLDRGRVVLFGGRDASRVFDDVWEWDGTNWQRVVYRSSPPARSRPAIAYDPGRTTAVMFGGVDLRGGRLSDTWIWDGSDWRAAEPAVAPPARAEHALAFDTARGRAVLFGGGAADRNAPDGVTRLGDTWEWDGATWIEQHPATSPPPRRGHAMAYDAARGTTLLFGGEQLGVLLGDQWAWDGARWTSVVPASAPPRRTEYALTYDASRERVVLFGGRGDAGRLSDVWEWDGASWTDRSPPTVYVPAARTGATMVYDPVRRRVVVFGGQSDTASLNDSWEWDGTTWTPLAPTVLPAPRHHQAMAYDAARGDTLVFGGDDGSPRPLRDTWLLRYEDPARSFESCRGGIDLDGDGKAGCDDPDCAAYCAACGDGVCGAAEDCRLCPADCGSCPVCGDLQCDAGESCTTCPADCGQCPAHPP